MASRIEYIKRKLEQVPGLVWTNQYSSQANVRAHYEMTAAAVHREFPSLDYLFVGAGTIGTLYGCTRFFAETSPETKVVAIDSVGSVTFGGAPGKRFIPGMGTSLRPAFADQGHVAPADVLYVPEEDGLRNCRDFSKKSGLLIGGSTGSVIAGFKRYVADHHLRGRTAVLISPDLGQAYLSTIYSDSWVRERFPAMAADSRSPETLRMSA